ncbi:MAG TPA: hypothetical protein V6D47_05570 [Oscillatoriaceae cyanobacterium]
MTEQTTIRKGDVKGTWLQPTRWLLLACVLIGLAVRQSAGAVLCCGALSYLAASFVLPPSGSSVRLVSLALGLRLVLAYFLPHWFVYDDERFYQGVGTLVATALRHGATQAWNYNPWTNTVGLLDAWFGDFPMVVKAFNTWLGILSGLVVFQAVRQATREPRLASIACNVVLVAPPVVFLSAIALKEQIVALALLLLYAGLASEASRAFAFLLGGLVLMLIFRDSLALVLLPLVLAFKVFTVVRSPGARRVPLLHIVGVLGLSWICMFAKFEFQCFVPKPIGIVATQDIRGEHALLHSKAYFVNFVDRDHPFAPRNLVLGPIRSLCFPSPFRIFKDHSPEALVQVFLQTLPLYLAYPFAIAGAWLGLRRREGLAAIGLAGIVFGLAAESAFTDSPETFRYYIAAMPLVFLLAAFGWQIGGRPLKRLTAALWWGTAFFMNTVYLVWA